MYSSRPYLIRALYEWLADNHLTPYLAVDATQERVMVPAQHVHDGQIVLNIAMSAVRQLELANDAISFSARFGGVPQQVYIPVEAVIAIYAKENGQGMAFGHEPCLSYDEISTDDEVSPLLQEEPSAEPDAKPSEKRERPVLKVIK